VGVGKVDGVHTYLIYDRLGSRRTREIGDRVKYELVKPSQSLPVSQCTYAARHLDPEWTFRNNVGGYISLLDSR